MPSLHAPSEERRADRRSRVTIHMRHERPGSLREVQGRSVGVYVAHTLDWLHERLTIGQRAPGVEVRDDPDEADIVLFPIPEWTDARPRDSLPALWRRAVDRLFVLSFNDRPVPWGPGVYASLPAGRYAGGPFRGGHYFVHHHEGGLTLAAMSLASADLLWTFVGSRATCPGVRGAVLALQDDRGFACDTTDWHQRIRWSWETTHRAEGAAAFDCYRDSIERSLFVVCPRGVGNGSMRVFEAMESGRCPVVISDDWMPPPFVDWEACSIRIAEDEVRRLPQILREREPEAAALGAQARAAWEQWFAPDRRLAFTTAACRDIEQSGALRRATRNRIAIRSLATRPFANRLRSTVGATLQRPGPAPRSPVNSS